MFSVCLIQEPKETEWYNQWSYVLSHWKPDNIFVIGDEINTAYKVFRNAVVIPNASVIQQGPLVLFQPINAMTVLPTVSIGQFVHPLNPVYMFGADHTILDQTHLGNRTPDHIVYIPTDNDLQMYSWTAGAVALYDRKVKNG